jgi:hypothetical protein
VTLTSPSRSFAAWLILVVVVYGVATGVTELRSKERVDTPTVIAANLLHGQLSMGYQPGATDAVTRDGQTYHIISLGPVLPYLVLAPFTDLHLVGRWLISMLFGILAAVLAWPFATRYGPGGRTTWWLATLAAFGTLLFPLSVRGNFYYLAHAEAMACTFAALIEWHGRRRSWVVAGALALGALARPTLLLALAPLAASLLWTSRSRIRVALGMAWPVAASLAAMGAYNAARFGSPLDVGYSSATLVNPVLIAARSQGLLSLSHVRDNLTTLLVGGFGLRSRFPWLEASQYGHSIFLTTPALVAAAWAPWRDWTTRLLGLSAALVTAFLLLYYGGGGYNTYGYRYFLDATPFLLALVAMAARRRFGRLEQVLIVASVAFCSYGVLLGFRGLP